MRIPFFILSTLVILSGMTASCSFSNDALLTVKSFHLRDVEFADSNAEMARGEQLYRLRGAVTMEERMSRLGYYYTVSWKRPPESVGAGDLRMVMDYQQASTASQVLRMSQDIPQGEDAGKVEFRIAGESYRAGGRLLAWRIQMLQGRQLLAEKSSYFWK